MFSLRWYKRKKNLNKNVEREQLGMITTKYINLLAEIEGLEIRLKDLEFEYKLLYKNMYHNAPRQEIMVTDYTKERVSGGQVAYTLDQIVYRLQWIEREIQDIKQLLEEKQKTKYKLLHVINTKTGIHHQVAVLHHIEGYSLKQIAQKLDRNYSYIRRIAAELKNKD